MWEPDGPIECCPVCGSHQSYIPEKCGTLTDGAHMGGGLNGQDVYTGRVISISGNVRRLTTLECERLQGFPDGWTDVPHRGKPAPDGPRYKAIGNSMAVPVMRWIGNRIQMVEELMHDRE